MALDDVTWHSLLSSCAAQLGDDVSDVPQSWELCTLAQLAAKRWPLNKRRDA